MNADETVLDFGAENEIRVKKRIVHPTACFFHIFFRLTALLVYLFCGLFTDNFVTSFVCILLLLSADFWTVKNVTGRLLVGLRWWNKVEENGKSSWVYESRKPAALKRNPVMPSESKIFWLGLFIFPMLWFVMLFSTLFGFKPIWLAVVVIALVFNGGNVFGYTRCKFKSKKQIGSLATKYIGAQLFQQMANEPDTTTNISSGQF